MARLRRIREKEKRPRLHAVRPNAGLDAMYRRKILGLVDEMGRSVTYWLKAAYREDLPVMAMDATPAKELQRAIDQMTKRWERKFDDAAEEFARWFAQRASRRSDDALKAILKRAGFSVKFTMTPAMRDIIAATVEQNVGLIKSIPAQYLTQVQGSVMRSVTTGRDLASLSRELQENFGVTRRRAALISLDQNNKITSALQKARQTELGIQEGIWLHSHAGKEPRPTHLANHGKKFSIAEGWYDPDPRVRKRIMPGELIRCRCVWRPVVPGLT